jgi:pyrroloquinoline quinone (PQQ) biosynthesis protein C
MQAIAKGTGIIGYNNIDNIIIESDIILSFNYISCTDDNFKVNLDNLLIHLRAQVSPLWYQFGEAAGIETEMLEKLANDCSPQERIIEMFDYWLRKQKEPLTWKDIAKILKMIDLEQLAAKIEEIYTTGNYIYQL